MRRAARVDPNQKAIVDALRKVGATVQHLHQLGQGCPDLLVAYRDALYLMEVKQPKGKLTPDQVEWIRVWGGPVFVVRTPEEALLVLASNGNCHAANLSEEAV